jgi:ABC-type nitrate/sulfonate/bicarbonate transport system permease component
LAIGVTLIVLQIIPVALDLPTYLFPSSYEVLRGISENFQYVASNAGITFFEALCGLLVSGVIGLTIGALSERATPIGNAALRSAAVLQTIPIVAVAPLIILWSGPGILSKIVMATLVGLPPVLVAAVEGFRSAPSDLINTLRVMGVSRSRVLLSVRLPYALSHISVGLRVTAALSTIGAIVAEYAGSTQGIGYVVMQSSYRLDTPLLFAAVWAAIICGLALVAIATLISDGVMFAIHRR